MNVELHLLTHDHEQMLTWALRHYVTFARRIVVHDGGPQGFSRVTAQRFGAECSTWNTDGKLNDELAMKLKNDCWKGTDADWVIVVDCDEFVYFPEGVDKSLQAYESIGAAIIKPHGFEMFSDVFPTGDGQIYDEVKMGATDDKWYAKPILFSPKRVEDPGFGIGAHEARATMATGQVFHIGSGWGYANPPAYLLHMHQIGPIEHVAQRYDDTRKRLAKINEMHGWGNFKPGMVHAQEKRDYILPRLRQVIA